MSEDPRDAEIRSLREQVAALGRIVAQYAQPREPEWVSLPTGQWPWHLRPEAARRSHNRHREGARPMKPTDDEMAVAMAAVAALGDGASLNDRVEAAIEAAMSHRDAVQREQFLTYIRTWIRKSKP